MPTESTGIKAAIKFNPHLWGPDELRAIFVVRRNDLADILDALRASAPERVPQHLLIAGHRGMGKSTLLQRLALAVAEDPTLDGYWLPLTFPEEQYTVRTLTELWRNVIDALADALERRGAPPAELAALDTEVRRIGTLPPAEAEAAALAVLDRWVADHRRGLVLLVDSTDLLFNALAQGEGKAAKGNDTALWRLRKALSHHAGLFWIGTSYQALEAHHDYREAFHDFFALHELRPLTVAEMRAALLALARQFGIGRHLKGDEAEAEMARILDARPERLQALRLLSGGNPRTTVTLYELFSAGGDDSIQSDLKRLLDIMTPLYKARMEALSEQPQKILAHLMEHWHPLGVKELAAEAGIPATTVSGQLSRLETDGLIEKAALPGNAKRSGYQVCERFFNVWYLMRYGTRRLRQRLTWAVQFMRLWYSRDELADLAATRTRAHTTGSASDAGNLEFSRAVAAALGDDHERSLALEWSVLAAAHRECNRNCQAIRELLPSALFDFDDGDSKFKGTDDYLRRFAALDAQLAACPHAPAAERDEWIAVVKRSISLTLSQKEQLAAKLATDGTEAMYRGVRDILVTEKQTLHEAIGESATTIFDAVVSGEFFPDCPNSEIALTQLELCFGSNPAAYRVALELFAKAQRDDWVVKAYRRAIELSEKPAYLFNNLGNLLQDHLKRYDEAEAAYRQAIAIDDKYASPWNGLGNLLQDHLKRYDEAEAAYRQAIAIDGKLASPWNNLGNLLKNHLKRYDEAEAAYRQAVAIDDKYASPWNGLGNLLQDHLKRYDEAEAAYRQAIAIDGKFASPWNGLGNLLHYHLKRYDEAEAAYRQAIAIDDKLAYPWSNLGNLLQDHLKRYDEAEAAYRQAIAIDDKYASPWNGLGNLLHDHLKRYHEAEAAYRQAIALDSEDPYPIANLARLIVVSGNEKEASSWFRKTIELSETDDHNLRLQAHLWLGNRDLAQQALASLATAAEGGDAQAFFRLREQCWECADLGLANALVELMAASPWADFLQPFALALMATVTGEAPVGAAPEILSLAQEILAEIQTRRRTTPP